MVYVLSYTRQALMPTENHAKVRVLLNTRKARVIKRCPFTIQLLYKSTTYTQDITLGVDAGSKHIGLSATTDKKVLFESDVTIRNDIMKLLSARRELRKSRRNRKTRYREPRFLNRTHSKKQGWLAPSVNQKVDSHLMVVSKVCRMLPITKIVVETASFDIQKIKNSDISGADYQQGEQLGFWNVREYVLFRDNHECQCCHGKSQDQNLNVHHIESRQIGGDAPNNLITLCETCHTGYHKGKIKLPKEIHRGMRFRDAAFMGIMRWAFYNKLKKLYASQNILILMTYGYVTKNTRIKHDLPKEHFIDARCISGHPDATPPKEVFYQKKVRCHNRQIHKLAILKGGARKRNQAAYLIKGYRLYDVVKAKGAIWYIHGRRSSGAFVLKNLSADKLEIVPAKIKHISQQHGFIVERRTV